MADQDLIAYARDAASRGDDLFALLGTDATASEGEIRRAFRRKALTAHPDKAGDAYDPALYERIERARDVLTTPEAREAYDGGMRAVLQKKMQMDQMSDKRRRMVEDLERREEEARAAKRPKQPDAAQEAWRRDMAARGRAKMAEMRRMREEAEAREQLAKEREAGTAASGPSATSAGKPDTTATPQDGQPAPQPTTLDDYDKRIEELEQRLKDSKQRKAEKQQRKEQRKADKKPKWDTKAGTPSGPGSPEKETSDNPPPPPPAAEPQADEDKVSAPAEAAPPAPQPGTGDPPKASDRFASTLARLRAAQAKKDEDKRRKAEEARVAGAP